MSWLLIQFKGYTSFREIKFYEITFIVKMVLIYVIFPRTEYFVCYFL